MSAPHRLHRAVGSPVGSLVGPLAGLGLAALLLLPPAGQALERLMLTHMLLQMPALCLAGALMAPPLVPALRAAPWNLGGVPMLLAVALVLTFWMLPITVDRAVASVPWDLAKGLSLVAAGAVATASWHGAPPVVQAFFVGNGVWMGVTAGLLYMSAGPRLCNAYLLDDQAATGRALTGLGIAAAALWLMGLVRLFRTAAAAHPPPVEGEPAHES